MRNSETEIAGEERREKNQDNKKKAKRKRKRKKGEKVYVALVIHSTYSSGTTCQVRHHWTTGMRPG